jgi:hypothetical protein
LRQNDYDARSFFDQPIAKSPLQAGGRQWVIDGDGRSTNRPNPREAAPLRSGLGHAGCEAKDRRENKEDVRRRRGHLDDRGRSLLHSTLASDTHRKVVLQILLPESHVTLIARRTLPRHRSLTLELAHRRRPSILLDQVFGSWSVEGCSHHDFAAKPPAQACRLRTANFHIVERQVSRASIAKKLD